MIGITNIAIDNEFDLVIVLGGTNKILYNQNISRFRKYIDSRNISNKKQLRIYDNELVRSIKGPFQLEEFVNKYTIVLVLLKGAKDTQDIIKHLDYCNFDNKKLLILDDECDNASVNIGSKGNISRIYKSISLLRSSVENSIYIGVTATPYANLLTESSEKLYPDKIITIKSTKRYTGLYKYHTDKQLNYINLGYDKDCIDSWEDTVYRGVLYYLITAGIKKEILPDNEEMLINIELDKPSHSELEETCAKILYKMKYFDEENFEKGVWYEIWKSHNQVIDLYNISKKRVLVNMVYIINYIRKKKSIILLNSDNERAYDYRSGEFEYTILIGGHMVSRGFTFRKLLTELILNAPETTTPNADTTLQRARWFGYRLNNNSAFHNKIGINRIDYIRILMSNRVYLAFLDLFSLHKELDIYFEETKRNNQMIDKEVLRKITTSYNHISPASPVKIRKKG